MAVLAKMYHNKNQFINRLCVFLFFFLYRCREVFSRIETSPYKPTNVRESSKLFGLFVVLSSHLNLTSIPMTFAYYTGS